MTQNERVRDLISRAALLNDLTYCAPELWQDEEYIKAKINKQPTVDAVQVVRCKDCKHWKAVDCCSFFTCKYDILNGFVNKGYGFCSYGERKSNVEGN